MSVFPWPQISANKFSRALSSPAKMLCGDVESFADWLMPMLRPDDKLSMSGHISVSRDGVPHPARGKDTWFGECCLGPRNMPHRPG